jgi:VNT family MFS transporter (synaptic vesicle glycoprotein 2)
VNSRFESNNSKSLELKPVSPIIAVDGINSLTTSKSKYIDPEGGFYTKADFEQAIELAGYGKFHYVLLAICGLLSMAEESDIVSMAFIIPSSQCDLDLNTEAKGFLNSIIFVGMMVRANKEWARQLTGRM